MAKEVDPEIVVSIDKVYKDFSLSSQQTGSIKSSFTHIFNPEQKEDKILHALRNISCEIHKGEFFGIVGRNGSGKSTLLKIIAGIYQPNKGSIHVKGKLVPFIELGVGFNPELTGRENVYLNGALLGFSRKEMAAQYDDIVQFAELERFMDQKLKNYSSGMQVRLAFSLATRSEADILLVDEVLAVGDADFQRKCFDYFRQLKKNSKTVIFVTHDMGAVRQYCDRAMMIEKSRIILSGTPDEVATEYTRMFSEEANFEVNEENKKRWGNKFAAFASVRVSPDKVDDKKEQVVVRADIIPSRDIEDLVVGFSVKDATDRDILGTNTRLLHIKTGKWKKGKRRIITWTMPNVFSDGNYSVDVALLEEDATTVCDWWEAAAKFISFEESPTGWPVNPDIQVELSQTK